MTSQKFGMTKGKMTGMLTLLVALVLLLSSGAAQAQAATPGEAGWNYGLIVYGWGTGLSGDLGPNIKQFEVHASTSDILSNLDFAAMAHFEAHNGKWGILVDPIYANLGKTVESQGRRLERTIDLNLEASVLGVAGSYQITKSPDAGLDFTFGGRYTGLSADITPRRLPAFHASYSWVDPVVGLMGSVKMSKAWTFGYRADIGGFGVGSDLTWSGALTFDAKVSKAVSITFGYVALYNDYAEIHLQDENDARAYAWGEYKFGAGRGSKAMVCMTLGTGYGCALIADSKPYCGSDSSGGLLGGHISIDRNGPECSCGNKGCLEGYCSATALTKKVIESHSDISSSTEVLSGFSRVKSGNAEYLKTFNQL